MGTLKTRAIIFGATALLAFGTGCSKSESDKANAGATPSATIKSIKTSTAPEQNAAAKPPPGPPIPKEPAVLQASITKPGGGTCNATIDADCVACIRKEGRADLPEACDKLKGNATTGPGAGVAKAELCHEALDCMRRTACHANSVIDCYCGKMTGGECTTTNDAKGVCKKEFDRALEIKPMSLGGAALDIITEPSLAGGVAGLTATAESSACASVCLPYKATSCP